MEEDGSFKGEKGDREVIEEWSAQQERCNHHASRSVGGGDVFWSSRASRGGRMKEPRGVAVHFN